ncbi:MAG: hypothetical protein QM736_00725 [Vicinamibacterales bacterium]
MIHAVDVRSLVRRAGAVVAAVWLSMAIVRGLHAQGAGASTSAGNRASRPRTERMLIRVPISDAWTATGLHVDAGDRITIHAWGSIVVDRSSDARTIGPNGMPFMGAACEHLVADEHVHENALVTDVATEPSFRGGGVSVGTNWSATAPIAKTTETTGELFLGVNHRHMACDRSGFDSWALRNDSAGAFTVEVTVIRHR